MVGPRRIALCILAVVAMAGGAACQQTGPGSSSAPSASASTPLVVGLGFIPSVQFAQFYLAEERGYYRAAGLAVELQNRIDPELITLLGQGAIDIGNGDGTSVIPAVSQGIPVRYVATVYARFPSVVFAKASSGIATPADLAGRSLGIPGRFGGSWIMLQALLASAGLDPDDLTIRDYPDFGQGVAVAQDQVEAATGFINNEPIQLERSGDPATILRVDEITPLPGPGLVVGTATLESKREPIRAFIAATLRAMAEIAADPDIGVEATVARVPDLGQDRALQRAILDATIQTWQSPITDANGLGAIDRAAWQESVDFMAGLPDSVVARPVTLDELLDDSLLPPP